MSREQQAYKRLFSGAKKPAHSEPIPPKWPKKTLSLTGPQGHQTIVMEQKYGVWFITNASGAWSWHDFGSTRDGWGITQPALDRFMRHTGFKVATIL